MAGGVSWALDLPPSPASRVQPPSTTDKDALPRKLSLGSGKGVSFLEDPLAELPSTTSTAPTDSLVSLLLPPEIFVYPPETEDEFGPCLSLHPNIAPIPFPRSLPVPPKELTFFALHRRLSVPEALADSLARDLAIAPPRDPTPRSKQDLSFFLALLQLVSCLPYIHQVPSVVHLTTLLRDLCSERFNLEAAAALQETWIVTEEAGMDRPRPLNPMERVLQSLRAVHEETLAFTQFGYRFRLRMLDTGPDSMLTGLLPHSPRCADVMGATGQLGGSTELSPTSPSPLEATMSPWERELQSFIYKDCVLELDTSGYSEHEKVPLITLIHSALGYPQSTFFFGGPPPTLLADSQRRVKFTRLPRLLTLVFSRPFRVSTGGGAGAGGSRRGSSALLGAPDATTFHPVNIEMPTELDLGFTLNDGVPCGAEIQINRAKTKQKTMFKLHGFITRAQEEFITYTRLSMGTAWWRIGHEVTAAHLSARIESKGVLVAVYRLLEGPPSLS